MKFNRSRVIIAKLIALMVVGLGVLGVFSLPVRGQARRHATLGGSCSAGHCAQADAIFGPVGDFDGSGQTNYAVFRPSEGNWYVLPSDNSGQSFVQQWGANGDIPVPGDYDGDGITDFAIFRPSEGNWYILPSSAPGSYIVQQWGASGDIPVPGDYDNDGITDFAIFRPSEGNWYIIPSSAPTTYIAQQWGMNGDIPMPGDYDGDGQTDFAVWRPSEGNWYIIPSSAPTTYILQQWGSTGDNPVSGDFDGDGITDFAVWRLSEGNWYVIPSSNPGQSVVQQWGTSGDLPVPGDYDGDGITDFAVWRPSNGTWYVLPSSAPGTYLATPWGISTDEPTVDTAPEIGTSQASSATVHVPASPNSGLGVVGDAAQKEMSATPPEREVHPLSDGKEVIEVRGNKPVEEALKPVRYLLPEGFAKQVRDGGPVKELKPVSDLSKAMGVPWKVAPEEVGKTKVLVLPPADQKRP